MQAIRMKTTRQLKEIFEELGIDSKGSKDELQKRAYKEDAITRWEELHPEKKRKPRPAGGGGKGGGGFPNMGAPEGTDPGQWEDMMRQMQAMVMQQRLTASALEPSTCPMTPL